MNRTIGLVVRVSSTCQTGEVDVRDKRSNKRAAAAVDMQVDKVDKDQIVEKA